MRFPATLTFVDGLRRRLRSERSAGDDRPRRHHACASAIVRYGKNPAQIAAAAYRAMSRRPMSRCISSKGRCWNTKTSRSASSPRSSGQSYLLVEIFGEAGHAGTVPMMLRRDALAGRAEVILLAEQLARETRGEVVATVGRISVPGAGECHSRPCNAVRSISVPATMQRERVRRQFKADMPRHRRSPSSRPHHHANPRRGDDAVRSAACRSDGLRRLPMSAASRCGSRSGAGHDGQAMARLCPIAMMFVRCRGGISHNPTEYARPATWAWRSRP